jgi:hypothetical protein
MKRVCADVKREMEDKTSDACLLALLHDVVEPKFPDEKNAEQFRLEMLTKYLRTMTPRRAVEVMDRAKWSDEKRQREEMGSVDWNEVLGGEVMIRDVLSDSDKKDAMGVAGLCRALAFQKEKYPGEEEKKWFKNVQEHAVDKLLKLKDVLVGERAKKEGEVLHKEMTRVLEVFRPLLKESQLGYLADGLNIEGGRPGKLLELLQLSKDNKNGQPIWANAVMVLDTPLKVCEAPFSSWVSRARALGWDRLESLKEEINEKQMLAMILSWIHFYTVTRGKKLLVHIHQGKPHGEAWIKWIKRGMQDGETLFTWKEKVSFVTDDPDFLGIDAEQLRDIYTKAEVVLSVSQCAGLDPVHAAGTWLLPEWFIHNWRAYPDEQTLSCSKRPHAIQAIGMDESNMC